VNLLSPLSLLWFLPIGGVILTLYLLRLKRRDQMVPSVMLWAEATQDMQANAPFQRLRRNPLLFLQLLAALALVAALAKPFLWASGLGGKTTALILDGTASMCATDESGSRFAAAVAKAKNLVEQKGRADQVAIVLLADRPTLIAPLTSDKQKLLTALSQATPSDASGDIREAILFGGSLVASRAEAQVTVLTDGAFGPLEAVSLGGAKLSFLTVGKRADNVGVIAFDVRDAIGGARRQAFVTVENFSPSSRTVPVELRINDRLADAHEVTLKSGESKSEVFDNLKADSGGTVQVRLDSRDDLESDNQATVLVAARRPIRVLLVTEGNPFLERALNSDARVVLDTVNPTALQNKDVSSHEVTVFDGAAPPTDIAVSGRYLFWGVKPGPSSLPITSASPSETAQPTILDWSRTHPLMRYVDLANVSVSRAYNAQPAPWGQTLAETDDGPLIVAGERGDGRCVWVGFPLLESDMPLRIAFPIFLTNALEWLSAKPGAASGGITRPGEVVALAARNRTGTIQIKRPDGGSDSIPATRKGNAPLLYDHTSRVGVYKATGSDNFSQIFAVSLLSRAESRIAPTAKPQLVVTDAPGLSEPKTAGNNVTLRREVWQYAAAIVLLILCAEWLFFHRRLGR
jgi:Ca-activated chloride channel family protein